jgi:riboflavin-specific deaminase-like protein
MKIFSNLATSIDGKIAFADRSHAPLGTRADWEQMLVLRKRADVVLFGAATLRTFRKSCGVPGSRRQPTNAVVSRSLEGFDPSWPFFQDRTVPKILFATDRVSPARKKLLAPYATIIELRLKSGRSSARAVVKKLSSLGFKSLLVEGGGGVMWDFVSENLIDEFHVTLTPRILGGTEAPTLVDGVGFSRDAVLNLKLHRLRRVKDELYLTYRNTGLKSGLPRTRH